jgi:hypothetical protein
MVKLLGARASRLRESLTKGGCGDNNIIRIFIWNRFSLPWRVASDSRALAARTPGQPLCSPSINSMRLPASWGVAFKRIHVRLRGTIRLGRQDIRSISAHDGAHSE